MAHIAICGPQYKSFGWQYALIRLTENLESYLITAQWLLLDTNTKKTVAQKQQSAGNAVLSFNDALAVSPGISPSANIVRSSNRAAKPPPTYSSLFCPSGRVRGQWSGIGDFLPLCRALFLVVSLTSVLNKESSDPQPLDSLSDDDSVDDAL